MLYHRGAKLTPEPEAERGTCATHRFVLDVHRLPVTVSMSVRQRLMINCYYLISYFFFFFNNCFYVIRKFDFPRSALRPVFFGRVVARSDSVRFGTASGSGQFRN